MAANGQTDAAAATARLDGNTPSTPQPQTGPKTASTRLAARRAASKRRGKSKAEHAVDLTEADGPSNAPVNRGAAAALPGAGVNAEPNADSAAQGGGIKQLPPLLAQVAEHGPLYERVSFHNQPQWRAANESLWNAYRLASMTGQRSQQTAILLDILRLPQRVLPKMGRSGKAARRRATAATKHRMHNEAERLRERYNCPDPNMRDGQHTTMAVDTMEHTAAQGGYERPKRATSMAAAEAIRRQAADTTDADTDDAESGVAAAGSKAAADDSDDDGDEPFPSLSHRHSRGTTDPDRRAAQKANYLVQCRLTRKAAHVLHSTTQIADLRTAAAQHTMLQLHPQPPSNTVLPTMPEGAPPSVLEDDAAMRRLLTQSDNGSRPVRPGGAATCCPSSYSPTSADWVSSHCYETSLMVTCPTTPASYCWPVDW